MGTALTQFAVASGQPFVPPGPGGAARYRSYVFPDPAFIGANAGGSGNQGGRNTVSGQVGITFSGFNGGSTAVAGIINGLPGVTLNMTGTTGCGIRFQGTILDLKTSRNTFTPNDDLACIRVWANLAASAGSVLTQDQGFFLVHPGGTAQRLIQDAATGFGFFIGQNNVVSWMVRGPNGLITTNLTSTAGGFDITKHHSYEIIMVSSTATADAYLFALIDSIPQALPPLSRSWGAGTNLPPNSTVSALSNFAPEIIADIRVAGQTLHCYQSGVAFGPTIASLL
jgi:hypothetical protein